MQNLFHHKRINSDIPNFKLNHNNSTSITSLISESKIKTSRDTNQTIDKNSNSLSKRKEISPTPNQDLRKLSGMKNIKKINHIPKIKPKIGSELIHISAINSYKLNAKPTGNSPYLRKIGTPIKTNKSAVNSRNTSYNNIKPKETKIPMMKNNYPPKSYSKWNTTRDDVLNLSNLSKNSKSNYTSNNPRSSDRNIRNRESNSKSLSRNSKTSSKSRSGTPKFKNNIKKLISNNLEEKNNSKSINVLNKIKNLNKTHSNLNPASKSKSPDTQRKTPNLPNKIKNIQNILPKKITKMNNFIPKANGYTAIHVMNKSKNYMSSNNNNQARKNPINNEINYSNLYHSLLNKTNNYTNLNEISTTSSKLDHNIDKKISNNPSSNSIVSNVTNVTKEKNRNEFGCKIPSKSITKDNKLTNSKKEDIADSFINDLKFKEITTSPLIRVKIQIIINRPKMTLIYLD